MLIIDSSIGSHQHVTRDEEVEESISIMGSSVVFAFKHGMETMPLEPFMMLLDH
jgi:hypothetical protein